MLDEITDKLRENGVAHESKAHPLKAKCNNCGNVFTAEETHPIITTCDSLSSEVFYCPECGPKNAP